MRTAENASFLYCPSATVHPAPLSRLGGRGDGDGRLWRTQQRRPQHLGPTGCPTIRRNFFRIATPAATIAPVTPATSTAKSSVISPKLGGLIEDYQCSAAFEALDLDLNASAREEAGMLVCRSLKTLIEATGNDSDLDILDTLAKGG
jgi:hypothetical protein